MSPPQRRSRLLLRLRQAAEGEELLTLLTAPDEDTFVAQLIAGLGTYPTYFDRLGEINRRGPAVLTAQPLLPDSAPQVRALTADGAHVVDVRPAADYAAAHIPGSLSIPLRDQFATWLGWLLPDTAPLAFVAGEAAGALTARFRRKQLLVAGWLPGIPVPFALAYAPSWGWIVAANALLGLNQGLTWSMTVNMKIDLVGPSRRGLATGLNEAAGYTAVGVTALLTGYLATSYGLRPVPELIGVVFVVAGLALALVVRDTAAHVALELANHIEPLPKGEDTGLKATFTRTSWHNRSLRGASQAGLVNNLNDGVTWGVFPLLFTDHGLGLAAVGLIKGLYPILWGLGQIPTGHLADRIGRKPLIVYGMLVQATGFVLALALLDRPLLAGILSAVFLGLGTAMVYPALIASISDHAHPAWRANALGTYRFWRDTGYAAGALVAGILADRLGLTATVVTASSPSPRGWSPTAGSLSTGPPPPCCQAGGPGAPTSGRCVRVGVW